jgi:acetoin utilization deacetylase AcuC-like enzyme
MKAFYCDHFVLPLPDGHRFPMLKYARLRELLEVDGRLELLVPDAASDGDLLRVHTEDYLAQVVSGALPREVQRRIGFPWSPELVERSRRSVGGTIAAARAALAEGVAANLAGGTHHAFPDRGEGFCVFNDAAVAIRAVQADGLARRVAVVDLDVHQGNGTAAVFAGDPTVLTLSVHGASNYPFRKEESDLDVALPDGTTDDDYLEAVEAAVRVALQWAPELILYVAGADAFEGDALGRLAVSRAGMLRRDELVLDSAMAAGVPVAIAMAGGYAPEVDDIAGIHADTVSAAADRAHLWVRRPPVPAPTLDSP